MRLVVISDTHGLHNRIQELPEGDVLIHAGDFMNSGYDPEEIRSFNHWLGRQSFEHRVVCGGNHDRYFQNAPHQALALLPNAIYLENDGLTIDNVSFWGSPYTPEFMNWAFMYPRGPAARHYWDQMPYDLEVLITHGPPFGFSINPCQTPTSRLRRIIRIRGRKEAQAPPLWPYPWRCWDI